MVPPPSPAKKSKKAKMKTNNGGALTLDKLKNLSHDLLTSRAHLNNLPVLLSVLSPAAPVELAFETLISLQAFFTPLIPEMAPASSKRDAKDDKDKDPEAVYKHWLRSRFDDFVNSLIEIAASQETLEDLRGVVVEALMEFVKQGKDGKFQSAIYHRFIFRIVYSTSSVDSLLELMKLNYFKYADVRYFTYTSIDKIAKNLKLTSLKDDKKASMEKDSELTEFSAEIAIYIIYDILSRLSSFEIQDKGPNNEMFNPSGHSKEVGKKSSKHLVSSGMDQKSAHTEDVVSSSSLLLKKLKSKFTKAWLSFLKLPLPLDVYKEVLATVHHNVIPYMANPAILCDFLTKSYDLGGVISVMALSGLFILMTQHGLEYPKFYEKLYALLTPAVFMAKHRAVFFQLLDACLKSSYLPAYLAAAFAKKLSRLALSVPPAGEMVIIAIIHNLLRRHPSINFLVHKQVVAETDVSAGANGDKAEEHATVPKNPTKHGIDAFNYEEPDPAKSSAMRSSLWEVDSLRNHYCPQVSRFVVSLENDLTVRSKTTEVAIADFSSGSYATIFKQEMRRRVKQVPLAFYRVTPSALFSQSDFPGWTFGDGQDDVDNKSENDTKLVKRQKIQNS